MTFQNPKEALMDPITSDFGSQKIQNLSHVTGTQSRGFMPEFEEDERNKSAFDLKLSGLGKILASVKESGSVDRSDVQEFFDEIKQAMASGSVDVTSLAEDAPEWLKSAAEDVGIDLVTALTEFIENAPPEPNGQFAAGRPPERPAGPPPEIGDTQLGQLFQLAQEADTTDEEGIRSFLDSLREALESGSTDVASLAENAPDWLKTAAEESGLDLTDSLDEFLAKLRPMGNS
jgi:hypothetical protein